MAKDKEEKDDGYEFVPPDFDEDAFIHREMVAFKTTSILFVWSIVAAAVSWVAFILLKGDDAKAWPAGLAICAAFGLALKPLFRRFADISHFTRKNWVGSGFLFFFCWLAFVTVAVNPPLSDVSPPQVMLSADPPVVSEGGMVAVNLLASDNGGTPQYTLEMRRDQGDWQPLNATRDNAKHDHFQAILSGDQAVPGSYMVRAQATDGRGHKTAANATFTVVPGDFMAVTLPAGGNVTTLGGEKVEVRLDARSCMKAPPPCVLHVYFDPGAEGQRVPFEYDEALEGWQATARFAGWKAGENRGHVAVVFANHYQGPVEVKGVPGSVASVLSREEYVVRVTPPSDPEDRHLVEVPAQPLGPMAPIPGYGLLGALVAVLGAAAFLRRRD